MWVFIVFLKKKKKVAVGSRAPQNACHSSWITLEISAKWNNFNTRLHPAHLASSNFLFDEARDFLRCRGSFCCWNAFNSNKQHVWVLAIVHGQGEVMGLSSLSSCSFLAWKPTFAESTMEWEYCTCAETRERSDNTPLRVSRDILIQWKSARRSSSCNVSTASRRSDSELCHYCQRPSMNGRGIAAVMFVWKLAGSVKPDGSGFIFAMFCRFLFYFDISLDPCFLLFSCQVITHPALMCFTCVQLSPLSLYI